MSRTVKAMKTEPYKRSREKLGETEVLLEASVDGSVSGLSDSGMTGALNDARRRFTGLWRVGIRAMPFWLNLQQVTH